MSPENTEHLLREFPQLYRRLGEAASRSPWPCVFACGDGWLALIHSLSRDISLYAAGQGLAPVALQVKEKFGTLRFYLSGGDEVIRALIERAEQQSATRCMRCGATGRLLNLSGLCVTLCASCEQVARDERACH